MSLRVYSQKEIAVFEGVLKLLEGGADLYSLRVSEIAQAAGLGKGTLYNYFESKEHLLVQTVVYYVGRTMAAIGEQVAAQEGFQNKFAAMLRSVSGLCNSPPLQLLLNDLSPRQFKPALEEYYDQLNEMYHALMTAIDGFLDQGVQEGVLPAAFEADYGRYVFLSLFMGYFQQISSPFFEVSPEQAIAHAYALLLGGLRAE